MLLRSIVRLLPLCILAVAGAGGGALSAPARVDSTTLRGKVMCGYQGWFRCPGDASGMGWVHWSRDRSRIAPDTLTFEMWPDMSRYPPSERYPAPGFTYPDGRPAALFSSDNGATVLRHFGWMRVYGIDGAWLQRFVVGLRGGPLEQEYGSFRRVMDHVIGAAAKTGRVWAIAYDCAAMPPDRTFEALTADWRRLVDEGVTRGPRYLHEGGKPVVLIWGFYRENAHNPMNADLANRLIDFFHASGPYAAFLAGGGDWAWRTWPDAAWTTFQRRFDAYVPWNVGNYSLDAARVKRASTHAWADDLRECRARGQMWIPVVYPGFSWDNLTRKPPGSSLIERRRGAFLREQFETLARIGVDCAYVAMFDEVDEGTAIFPVTSAPPTQAHFVGYEGLPSDAYLRVVRDGIRLLRAGR